MVGKAIKLTSLFLVVGIALYIVTFNGAPTTIYFSGSSSFQASTGVILIVTFSLGVLFASIIAAFFAMKGYLRERHLIWRDKQSQNFFEYFEEARGLSAVADDKKARATWETLIKSDPTRSIARLELAKLHLASDEPKDALRLLDEARASRSDSLEILKLAADVNLALGNRTAALDNLSLILDKHPTAQIAVEARELAEELQRPEAALRFHEILYKLGKKGDSYESDKTRLEYKILIQKTDATDQALLTDSLSKFVKKHKNYSPALARLAAIEQKKGNVDKAAQHLADAARSSNNSEYWYEAAKLWLKNSMPESALSAARTAVREASGERKVQAELDLIRLYIALSRLEEARAAIDSLTQSIVEQQPSLEAEYSPTILILKALCLNRLGQHRDTGAILTQLSKFEYALSGKESEIIMPAQTSAPSPQLSTP